MDNFLRVSFKYRENEFNYEREKTRREKPTMKSDYEKILDFCKTPRNINEIMELMNLKHKPTFRKNYLLPLLNQDKLEMTIPNQPRNRNQKYVKKK